MTRTFVREHYQITLPNEVRKGLPVDIGDPVEIYVNKKGEITVRLLKTIDASQAWFWTKEHQAVEKEAEKELLEGKGKKVKSARDLIDELDK